MKENKMNKRRIHELSFSKEELNELIQAGILYDDEKFYIYNGVDDIYNFATKLFQLNKIKFSDKCLRLCYSINPFYYKAASKLFAQAIHNQKIDSAIDFLRNLLKCKQEPFKSTYNTYLYILSYITSLPEDLKEKAKRLNKADLLIGWSKTHLEKIEEQNNIRIAIYNQEFSYAQSLICELRKQSPSLDKGLITLSKLLSYAISSKLDKKIELEGLIKSDNFNGAINFLEREKTLHRLNVLDRYTYITLMDLEYLNERGKLPKRYDKPVENPNVYDAIYVGDYRLAKDILDSYPGEPNFILERVITKVLETEEKQAETTKKITLK